MRPAGSLTRPVTEKTQVGQQPNVIIFRSNTIYSSYTEILLIDGKILVKLLLSSQDESFHLFLIVE